MVETIPVPTTANRPRTRQRAYKKPPVLDVPDIDQDATERKRVLNVLAQRRYRKYYSHYRGSEAMLTINKARRNV